MFLPFPPNAVVVVVVALVVFIAITTVAAATTAFNAACVDVRMFSRRDYILVKCINCL